jgi:hypothetical protein
MPLKRKWRREQVAAPFFEYWSDQNLTDAPVTKDSSVHEPLLVAPMQAPLTL